MKNRIALLLVTALFLMEAPAEAAAGDPARALGRLVGFGLAVWAVYVLVTRRRRR